MNNNNSDDYQHPAPGGLFKPSQVRRPHEETAALCDDYRSDDEQLADAIAEGLRDLADMIADHPHLAEHLRYTALNGGSPINIPIGSDIREPQAVADMFRRAGRASGATIIDRDSGEWQGTVVMFGPVGIFVYAAAERMQTQLAGSQQ